MNGVGPWKRVFFQRRYFLKRRVATRDVVFCADASHDWNRGLRVESSRCDGGGGFCGERPTIAIVGLGLKRRVATREVVCVGKEGGLKRTEVRAPFYFPSIDWVFLSLSEVSRNSMMASATFLLVDFSMPSRPGEELTSMTRGPRAERRRSTPARCRPMILAERIAVLRSSGVILTFLA